VLVIATIVIVGAYVWYHTLQEHHADILTKSQKTTVKSEQSRLETYRINTECELIYGFSTGKYPDGEKLPKIKIADLLGKYPQEFAPWQNILKSNETRTQFFEKSLPKEFSDMLVVAVMKESSIKPELKPIADLIMDPHGKEKLKQDYQQYDCKSYFDKQTKQP
jgi:hypothetical protein